MRITGGTGGRLSATAAHRTERGPQTPVCRNLLRHPPSPCRTGDTVARCLAVPAALVVLAATAAGGQPGGPVTESFDSPAVLQAWHPFAGEWNIVEGAYRETSEDYRTVTLRAGRFYDFDLSVNVTFLHIQRSYPTAGYAAVLLRAQDDGHYYALVVRQGGELELSEYTKTPTGKRPVWQRIATAKEKAELALYAAHTIRVQCRGTQITASVSTAGQDPPEKPQVAADLSKGEASEHMGDSAYLSGRVGFGSSHATVAFDDLSIQPTRAVAELVDRLAGPRELVEQVARRRGRQSDAQAAKKTLRDINQLQNSLKKTNVQDDKAWQEQEEKISAVVAQGMELRKTALLAAGGLRAVAPYVGLDRFRQYKGNLHAYTLHSSGALSPQDAVELYRRAGYHFVAFTDHDAYGDQDGGVLFPRHQNDQEVHDWNGDGIMSPERTYRSGKEAYVRDYSKPSPPWVDQEWDLNRPGSFVVLNALESSFGHPRIGCLGHPPGPIAQPREGYGFVEHVRRADGLIVLHHPSGWNAAPEHIHNDENLGALDGLEVYNGAFAGRTTRPGNEDGHEGFAEELWDACLDAGSRFWGFANDGTHSYDAEGADRPLNGLNVVWASDLTTAGILDALKAGRFYASCGVTVDSIRVTDSSITVSSRNASRIRVIGYGGKIIRAIEGSEMTYEIDGSERWIRVELENDERVLPEKTFHQKAWLQPIIVEELLTTRT